MILYLTRVKRLYSSISLSRTPPLNLKQSDEAIFDKQALTYTVPESYLVYIKNATVTDLGVIIKGLRPLKEFINCYEIDFKNYAFKYSIKALLSFRRIRSNPKEKHLLIFDNYSGPRGFFHWIADGLTRLVELKDIIKEYTVIVPEYFKEESLYTDTLSFFDIKKAIYLPGNSIIKVKHLYIADYIAPSGNYHPQNLVKLRDFIWEKCLVSRNQKPSSKIYISRKNANRRFVINEEEVIKIVKEYGFKVVYLEQCSFKEQVRLIFETEYLITIHGAALTHLFFMQPNSNVLEFRRENDAINNLYFNLASEAGVNYYYQACKAENISNAANNFNLIVDIGELESNIQLMFSNKQ